MQAQANRTDTQTISSAQSLAAVQTLLKAGLGCITFMRDLLPQDNFTESHFTTTDDAMSSSSSNSTFSSPARGEKENLKGFKIMTMSRGYTDEADRLLNYLEYGIFDALQKQYLKNFVFAIYLDNKDPNNIVEAYTFNFHYHTIAGTDTTIPIMSLGDDLKRMSLHGKDPVAEAVKRGTVPTFKDVKRSVKTLLKTLITSMTQMDVLPKRRYATFKVFYTDDTPAEYEPPHFKPGDHERDKWYFATHDMEEVPDTWSVGKVNAGWHELDVSVSSIATYLPSSTEHENLPFGGVAASKLPGALVAPTLTPAEEAAHRAEENKKQILDAHTRRVIWSAEEPMEKGSHDTDGAAVDGHHHPDFVRRPIGIITEDGVIRPLSNVDEQMVERHFVGASEVNPQRLKDILGPFDHGAENFPQTQIVNDSQETGQSDLGESWEQLHQSQMQRQFSQVSDTFSLGTSISVGDSLGDDSMPDTPTPCSAPGKRNHTKEAVPDSWECSPSPMSSLSSMSQGGGKRVASIEMRDGDAGSEAEELMKKIELNVGEKVDVIEDEEMLDLETQIVDGVGPIAETQTVDMDPIQSFESDEPIRQGRRKVVRSVSSSPVIPSPIIESKKMRKQKAGGQQMDCECGIHEEDMACACDGGCDRWFHIWCMGYHSEKDPRLPDEFICFDCRVQADPSWELIKVDLYPTLLMKFRELASFRRAIKVAERCCPATAPEFAKAMGCDNTQARQLLKRLETEDFIAEETTTVDDIGFVQTRAKSMKGKGKAKQTKPRRTIQKQKFAFNRQSVRTQEYKDYFNPNYEVENRLLGVPQTRASFKARKAVPITHPSTRPLATAHDPPQDDGCFPQTQSAHAHDQSQTQDDPVDLSALKRPAGPHQNDESRPKKKVKISIAHGVDLAE